MKSFKSCDINVNNCDMKLVRKCSEVLEKGWEECKPESVRYWEYDRHTKVDYIGIVASKIPDHENYDKEFLRNLVVYCYNLMYNPNFDVSQVENVIYKELKVRERKVKK